MPTVDGLKRNISTRLFTSKIIATNYLDVVVTAATARSFMARRQRIRPAVDCDGTRWAREQLQLAGQGAQLERIPRDDEARMGTWPECGLCRRRRKYRIRDGRAVPIRKKGHGEVPVPGDTDDYEWTGYIPFDQLPQALNPESGLIVTANARMAGPLYKPYLTDRWEEPYRTARIYDLLHDRHDLRPEDMLKVQTDTYSYPHAFLADQLSAAAKTVKPNDARAQKLIEGLKDWNGIADADSPEVSFLQAARRAALDLPP